MARAAQALEAAVLGPASLAVCLQNCANELGFGDALIIRLDQEATDAAAIALLKGSAVASSLGGRGAVALVKTLSQELTRGEILRKTIPSLGSDHQHSVSIDGSIAGASIAYCLAWCDVIEGQRWAWTFLHTHQTRLSEEEDTLVEVLLVPVARRILATIRALREARVSGIVDGAARSGASAFVLNNLGGISSITPGARRLLDERVDLDTGASLFLDQESNLNFDRLVKWAKCSTPLELPTATILRLDRGSGPIMAVPVGLGSQYLDMLPGSRLVVLLVELEPAVSKPDLMRVGFGLSLAEADVALSLTRGRTVTQVALERGVSRETVRGQLKGVYRKLGVTSQSQLVRLVDQLARFAQ